MRTTVSPGKSSEGAPCGSQPCGCSQSTASRRLSCGPPALQAARAGHERMRRVKLVIEHCAHEGGERGVGRDDTFWR
eukprot:scaffold71014_cov32-Tisochrysis_lutea.AAC.8